MQNPPSLQILTGQPCQLLAAAQRGPSGQMGFLAYGLSLISSSMKSDLNVIYWRGYSTFICTRGMSSQKSISATGDCLLDYLPLGLFFLKIFIRLLVACQWKSLPWLLFNIPLHGRAQSKLTLPRAAAIWSLDFLAGQGWCPRGCRPAWGSIPAACSPGTHVWSVGFREQSWGVASHRKYRRRKGGKPCWWVFH